MSRSRDYVWEMAYPNYIRNLLEVLKQEGIDVDSFCEQRGFDRENISLPTDEAPHLAYLRLAADAVDTYGLAGTGLKTGSRLTLADHGLLGYAISSCENLQRALEVFCNFSPVVGGYRARFGVRQAEAYMDFTTVYDLSSETALRFNLEESFSVWEDNIASKWGRQARWFDQVCFQLPAPPEGAALCEERFGCPVLFDQPRSWCTFDPKYLTLPFRGFNEQQFDLNIAQFTGLLRETSGGGGLSEEIRSVLARCTGAYPSYVQVCRHFNMSEATLRRRLAGEGTNYQQVLLDFRMQLARRYLRETELSVNEISYLTGYQDPANFNRAFRRSQQQSPQNYRREVAAEV